MCSKWQLFVGSGYGKMKLLFDDILWTFTSCNDTTPMNTYHVQNRVLEPAFSHPTSFPPLDSLIIIADPISQAPNWSIHLYSLFSILPAPNPSGSPVVSIFKIPLESILLTMQVTVVLSWGFSSLPNYPKSLLSGLSFSSPPARAHFL